MNDGQDRIGSATDAADQDPVLRRKRALYRAQHRGTKEMDWMIGRYAEARLAGMDDLQLTVFERFLQVSDPAINAWLLEPNGCDEPSFSDLIADIRSFNSIG